MTYRRALFGSTAMALIAFPPFAASAAPLAAAAILNDFNAVIYTNASTTSDIQGAAVVGGNLKAATVYSGPIGNQPSGFGALTVFGNTTGNPININNGGNAYVGGTKGAIVNFNGGGKYISSPGYTISNFETPLNALSQALSLLNSTSVLPTTGNNEVIKAIPGSNGIAVFNVTAAQLAAIPSYSLDINGSSTVVFNVSGNTTFNANNESGMTGANSIIWNFYNATSVNFGTQLVGTVLAPEANVTNNNQIDGTLIADSWSGPGELHYYAFTGKLPSDPVPEPASIALLSVGILGLGLIRKGKIRF